MDFPKPTEMQKKSGNQSSVQLSDLRQEEQQPHVGPEQLPALSSQCPAGAKGPLAPARGLWSLPGAQRAPHVAEGHQPALRRS